MALVRLDQVQQFAAVNLSSDPGAVGGKVYVPQCAQIRVTFALEGGRIGHLVWYGRYAGAFAGSVAQANAIMTALTTGGTWTALAAFWPPSTAITAVTIRNVGDPVNVFPEISSTNAAAGGTSASAALPNEVALAVTLRTAQAGKQARGRSFVPGWATNALGAGNVCAATTVTALQNWANTWGSAVASGSVYTHVLGLKHRVAYVSPKTGVSYPDRPAQALTITQWQVRDNHWDTIRNRGLH